MKTYFDSICPRCGVTSSATGISAAVALEITASHVCVDGVRIRSGEPTERFVPGPGERTKLDEEKSLC